MKNSRLDLLKIPTPKSLMVCVKNLPPQGCAISQDVSAEWICGLLFEPNQPLMWQATQGAHIEAKIKRESNGILFLTASAHFSLTHPCIRCLQELKFEVPLQLNLQLSAAPLGAVEDFSQEWVFEQEGDRALLEEKEDMATAYFKDDTVDLGQLWREQLFLDLPAYPSCNLEGEGQGDSCSCSFQTNPDYSARKNLHFMDLHKLKEQLPR